MSTNNRAVKILMKRDGMSLEEAVELIRQTYEEIQDEILNGMDVSDVDDIISANLGLEPDYLYDILTI